MTTSILLLKRYAKTYFAIFCIFLFALVLRTYSLGNNPAGLHGDEAAYGYNAYALLTTGTDEYGDFFPLMLKSFEDYKPALYSYFDIPFVSLLGLTETATRLPSALFGSLTVILIYFLVFEFFNNKTLSLLSAFLLAFSPWHINLSRTTSEVILSLFFLLLMIYSLHKLQNEGSKIWFVIAFLSAFFSFGTYTASRFYVVIMGGLYLLFSLNKIKNPLSVNKPILIVFLFILCMELVYSFAVSNNRFKQVSIFVSPKTSLHQQEQIGEDRFIPVFITRVFHNKIVNYSREILKNYSEYFTLDFLALNGGYPKRERIPSTGLFYIWQIPFVIIGLFTIFQKKLRWGFFLTAAWGILLIPAAITYDEIPNVYRTVVIVPSIIIFIAFGIYTVLKSIPNFTNKYAFIGLTMALIICLFEFSYYLHQYYVHENRYQPWYRNYPSKELVASINEYYPQFKKIVFTKFGTMSYIHILFYNAYDVRKYQSYGSPMDKEDKGFDKYSFVPSDCPITAGEDGKGTFTADADTLYVNLGHCVTPIKNAKELKTIYWGDDTAAFKLVQYIP